MMKTYTATFNSGKPQLTVTVTNMDEAMDRMDTLVFDNDDYSIDDLCTYSIEEDE